MIIVGRPEKCGKLGVRAGVAETAQIYSYKRMYTRVCVYIYRGTEHASAECAVMIQSHLTSPFISQVEWRKKYRK